MHVSCSKLFKELKNGIEILIGQVFKVMDQNGQNNIFDQLLKNRLAYLNFNAIFMFLEQFTIRRRSYFSKRCW